MVRELYAGGEDFVTFFDREVAVFLAGMPLLVIASMGLVVLSPLALRAYDGSDDVDWAASRPGGPARSLLGRDGGGWCRGRVGDRWCHPSCGAPSLTSGGVARVRGSENPASVLAVDVSVLVAVVKAGRLDR